MDIETLKYQISDLQYKFNSLTRSSDVPRDVETALRERLNLDSSNISHVRANRGSTQAISNITVTVIAFTTEEWDTLNEFINDSTGRFTASSTGYYHVSASVGSDSTSWTAGQFWEIFIYKNAVSYASNIVTIDANISTTPMAAISTTVYLNQGDYIDARVEHNNGGSLNIRADSARTFISIDRIS